MTASEDHSVSWWMETCGDDLTPRPPLDGSTTADVAFLGAGYTALWTALYLMERDPALKVVLEPVSTSLWAEPETTVPGRTSSAGSPRNRPDRKAPFVWKRSPVMMDGDSLDGS